MSSPDDSNLPSDAPDQLRHHTYDGIQEYDNRLPNWWLWTLYGAIIFAFGFWFYHFTSDMAPTDEERVNSALAKIEEARLAATGDLSNEVLWQMSENANIVEQGKQIFLGEGTCFSCHGQNLEGGIGLNLVDHEWKWGNNPMSVYKVVSGGSPDVTKGMIAWEPMLGPDKVKKVVAFILSHHSQDEMASATTINPPIAGTE
jgi:cytochrome c oxidase cbb3-type subunit 3